MAFRVLDNVPMIKNALSSVAVFDYHRVIISGSMLNL
jgi:hypothetical protein